MSISIHRRDVTACVFFRKINSHHIENLFPILVLPLSAVIASHSASAHQLSAKKVYPWQGYDVIALRPPSKYNFWSLLDVQISTWSDLQYRRCCDVLDFGLVVWNSLFTPTFGGFRHISPNDVLLILILALLHTNRLEDISSRMIANPLTLNSSKTIF